MSDLSKFKEWARTSGDVMWQIRKDNGRAKMFEVARTYKNRHGIMVMGDSVYYVFLLGQEVYRTTVWDDAIRTFKECAQK